MSDQVTFSELNELNADDLNSLSKLIVDVVADGASIGFLHPMAVEEAEQFWSGVLAPDVVLWVARWQGEIAGTVQLHLCMKPNGKHRAEIAKLMVHPNARRKGIAGQLMTLAEERAKREERSLLVLDTRAGDPSNLLYQSLGFIEAGRIPHFAASEDGVLHPTVYYYKFFG